MSQCPPSASASALLRSYYLYTYDKMVAPNVSLRREAEMSPEMLGALLKHHYAHRILSHDEPPMGQSNYRGMTFLHHCLREKKERDNYINIPP